MEESTSGLQEIFVFIGSPSDVDKERKISKKIMDSECMDNEGEYVRR